MRTFIKGVGFDNVTLAEARDRALELADAPGCRYVVTPNPEFLWLARKNAAFRNALNNADLSVADGIGVVYAAKILGTPLKGRVPGYELGLALAEALAATGEGVYLLGAKPGVAERAAEQLKLRYPGLRVCGCEDGYFQEDAPVLARINRARPKLLLFGWSFPRQELWMEENRAKLDCGLILGFGGSLDGYAGDVKRAPLGWQRLGLEWLYRLLQQPSRIKRMIKLPAFLASVVWERVRNGKAHRI